MTLTWVIWAIAAGMCAGAVYIFVIRKLCGGFVKALTDNGCVGAENAKSCEEMGISSPNAYVKKQLSETGGMHRMIKSTEDGKYYIVEDYVLSVSKKYPYDTTSVFTLMGLIIVILAVATAVHFLLPLLVDSMGDMF